ncbi:hypothetical protein ACWGJQ_23975 [Peribacillus simplex]
MRASLIARVSRFIGLDVATGLALFICKNIEGGLFYPFTSFTGGGSTATVSCFMGCDSLFLYLFSRAVKRHRQGFMSQQKKAELVSSARSVFCDFTVYPVISLFVQRFQGAAGTDAEQAFFCDLLCKLHKRLDRHVALSHIVQGFLAGITIYSHTFDGESVDSPIFRFATAACCRAGDVVVELHVCTTTDFNFAPCLQMVDH